MSDNTNTLFWVICGAIVVIAIYLLINTNITTSIDGIFSHFNNLWDTTTKTNTPTPPAGT